jgi:hypothetical protein
MAADFFGQSADEWAKKSIGHFHLMYHHKPPVSVELTQLDSASPEAVLAVSKFDEMMRTRLFTAFCKEMRVPLGQTESPIEELMLLALAVVASNEGEVVFRVDGKEYGVTRVPRGRRTCVTIQPQVEINGHRVDFLVEMASVRRDYSKQNATITLSKSVVVECDGHEFHEKTKEQAEKDKRRDRELQDAMLGVFRFTGSEITRNAFNCADQAIRFLRWGIWRYTPSTAVSVETLRKELENFLTAHGGLADTWIWDREELIRRKEDIWPSVELGIASEGPFYHILNSHYYGEEMAEAYDYFCDLVRSLGWCHEEITHYKVFFYRDPEPASQDTRFTV